MYNQINKHTRRASEGTSIIVNNILLQSQINLNTNLHPTTGTHSVIDLTLSDPTIYLDYNWKINEDNCGSDHYLIILESLDPKPEEKIPCWNVQKGQMGTF